MERPPHDVRRRPPAAAGARWPGSGANGRPGSGGAHGGRRPGQRDPHRRHARGRGARLPRPLRPPRPGVRGGLPFPRHGPGRRRAPLARLRAGAKATAGRGFRPHERRHLRRPLRRLWRRALRGRRGDRPAPRPGPGPQPPPYRRRRGDRHRLSARRLRRPLAHRRRVLRWYDQRDRHQALGIWRHPETGRLRRPVGPNRGENGGIGRGKRQATARARSRSRAGGRC